MDWSVVDEISRDIKNFVIVHFPLLNGQLIGNNIVINNNIRRNNWLQLSNIKKKEKEEKLKKYLEI